VLGQADRLGEARRHGVAMARDMSGLTRPQHEVECGGGHGDHDEQQEQRRHEGNISTRSG